MPDSSIILISIIYALLFIHEMDAIKNEEWKMFIILNKLHNRNAYLIFSILHLPLYCILLIFSMIDKYQAMTYQIVCLLLMVHTILHLFFERHSNNKLKSTYSRIIIYMIGILATIYLTVHGLN